MDYKRIYNDFIKDRREKEPSLTGYVERHHILPRSLGGGNDKANLIDLTPEDHFFAHLLLAKISGGKMISALWRMLQRTEQHWGRKETARRSYGMAQRIVSRYLAEKWTGEGNPLFNASEVEWFNYRTGETFTGTLYAMHKRFGGSRAQWTNVLKGSHPSIFGWLPAHRKSSHARSEKGKAFSFINRDGRVFNGTQSAFMAATGINAASASRVVRQASVTICGWRLLGTEERTPNLPKDGRRGANLGKGKTYRLVNHDGRRFSGTSEDLRLIEGEPAGFSVSVRLSMLTRGAAPSWRGWMLEKENSNTR